MSGRTGSYPLMNIADDFGLRYGAVLLFSDAIRRNRYTPHHDTAIDEIVANFDATGATRERRDDFENRIRAVRMAHP